MITTGTPQLIEVHPTINVTACGGESVPIDAAMAPVIQALWARDLTTLMCCQDAGESMAGGGMWPIAERWSVFLTHYAWLKMPISSAQPMLALLKETPEFRSRLAAKADGGWQSSVWLAPTGLVDYANIYFPREQIPELAQALERSA